MYARNALDGLLTLILLVIICGRPFIGVIYGLIARNVANKRGMRGEGFWWGFFLGIPGIIVMRCCPKY